MIDGLISGKVWERAQLRTSKTGSEFVTAKVRAPSANGEALFVNCVVFDANVARELLALEAGDSVALCGTLTPGAWIDREGQARPSLSMVVGKVLTLYGLDKKRKASKCADAPVAAHRVPTQVELGDDAPMDWLD